MGIINSVSDLIGNTPTVRLSRIEEKLCLPCQLLAKLEGFNPSGSVKDRATLFMLSAEEKRGRLGRGSVIVEPTSGNTGISLAMLSAASGYRAVIVMPSSASREREMIIRAYGGEVIRVNGGMSESVSEAEKMLSETEGSLTLSQFKNPENMRAHRLTTGPELYADTQGRVDIFVAGVGTAGTLMGVGGYLKEIDPSVRVIAVEPSESAVLSGDKPSSHKIQGIGAGFVPPLFNPDLCDGIERVSYDEAVEGARLLASAEGVFCGISSGAALIAAIRMAKNEQNKGKSIAVLLPDGGDRYLSCGLF